MKKALLITRVSGFVPQFEMSHVQILQEMGYEVHYAANYNTVVYGEDNSRLDGTGILPHQVDFFRSPFSPKVLTACKQLEQIMIEGQYDLLHCHMPMSGVLARLVAAKLMRQGRIKRAPVLYTGHGLHFYKGAPIKNWIYYPVERWLARYTDVLITINNEDYGRACRFPVRGRVEKIAGAGIDVTRFPDKRERNEQLRDTLGIGPRAFVLLSVGELTHRKNHRLVLEMMEQFKDENLYYILCGSGPLEEELHHLAKEKGLGDKMIFAGYCPDVRPYLAAADCFIFPSLQEGLPMALMEAMAAFLPVVALPIRGNTDLITHKKGGYLVPGHHFGKAVRELMKSKERCRAMGEWNRQNVQKFDCHIVDAQMRKIYESL